MVNVRLNVNFLFILVLIFPASVLSNEELKTDEMEEFPSIKQMHINEFSGFITMETSTYVARSGGDFPTGKARFKFILSSTGEITNIELIKVIDNEDFANGFLKYAKTIKNFYPFPKGLRDELNSIEIIRTVEFYHLKE